MEMKKVFKQQSKITFRCIPKPYENCNSDTFKQSEDLMDEPLYSGFAFIGISKLLNCETYYDRLQLYFSQDSLRLQYMDCDCFVLSIRSQNIIKDLKNLDDFLTSTISIKSCTNL